MVYVTVGTMFLDFSRLVLRVDEIARMSGERTVVQIGMGGTLPQYCEHFAFKPREEVLALQREARVVVCHAGIGSVIDALQSRRPLIVVPRLMQFNEHTTEHQIDLARAVERRGWGRMILDVAELEEAIAHPPDVYESYRPAREPLVASVRAFVEETAARKARRTQ